MRRCIRYVAVLVLSAFALSSCDGGGEPELSVLFIGNSHTSSKDLPRVFQRFAAAAGHEVAVESVTRDGFRLNDHVESGDAIDAIRRGGWDYVILQEQSVVPGLRSERSSLMLPAVSRLSREAAVYEAQPILMLMWARDRDYEELGFRDYTHMQSSIEAGTRRIAEAAGVPIAPVGAAWTLARDAGLSLYQDDGIHPDIAGTYLAAAVMYATIFDSDPRTVAFHGDIPSVLAQTLRKLAAEVAFVDRDSWDLPDE